MSEKDNEGKASGQKISRRDFLKYSAGVATVAVGATALLGKIPQLPSPSMTKPPVQASAEVMVISVRGDELTFISGEKSVKLRDAGLAGSLAIAERSAE